MRRTLLDVTVFHFYWTALTAECLPRPSTGYNRGAKRPAPPPPGTGRRSSIEHTDFRQFAALTDFVSMSSSMLECVWCVFLFDFSARGF